ncbi:hypothetical protein T01_12286 [Trichinella spiralis]|uniref:Uncharacterized protein n=1 Tax=Trichinella spiralis TaxID=6334 RepID=A0A0V1BJY9_TRISP|nr:hypothetical protein T01_12286 [Trichinella spiralis]
MELGAKCRSCRAFDSRTIGMELRPMHNMRLICLGSVKTSPSSRKDRCNALVGLKKTINVPLESPADSVS